MSELYLSADVLVVPSVHDDTKPLSLDMKTIHKAEARIHELAFITKAKAGEFVAFMTQAHREARDHRAEVKREWGRWKQRLKTLRGLVVLDRAPTILKQKELASSRSPAGSEDLRDSVVNTDAEYIRAVDKTLQVEAAFDLLDTKVETLRMAYFSAHALTKDFESKRDLSGSAMSDDPAAPDQVEVVQNFVNKHSSSRSEDFDGTGFGPTKI